MEVRDKKYRIFLRDVRLSDVNDTYLKWMNDPEVNRYMETRFQVQTLESIKGYVANHQTDLKESFWAICLPSYDRTLTHIGNIKIGPINGIHKNADISLFIGEKDLWGKGFGREAVNLATDYAFKNLNIHRLRAGVYESNKMSMKLFQSCDFLLEGIMKEAAYFEGDYIDVCIFGKVNFRQPA